MYIDNAITVISNTNIHIKHNMAAISTSQTMLTIDNECPQHYNKQCIIQYPQC